MWEGGRSKGLVASLEWEESDREFPSPRGPSCLSCHDREWPVGQRSDIVQWQSFQGQVWEAEAEITDKILKIKQNTATFALLYLSWFVSSLIDTTRPYHGAEDQIGSQAVRGKEQKETKLQFSKSIGTRGMRYNTQLRSKSTALQHPNFIDKEALKARTIHMYQQLIRIEGQEDILVSFAGELFYAKRETILRVCQDTRTNPT